MSILVITTGGTIGALPYPDPQQPPPFASMPPTGRDLVAEFLARDFPDLPKRCVSLEPRDSQLIDQAYRDHILALAASAAEDNIALTHGTDTLLLTARYFFEQAKREVALQGKKIIILGAMTPLANGPESDGYLNLRFSLQHLADNATRPGIYAVLCDFVDPVRREGWVPKLYPFEPGKYAKFYDSSDGSRNRLITLG